MRSTVVKLAAFTALCAFFTGWLFLTIGNIKPFRDTYSLVATFDDVTGLLRDDNVKVAGVVVGKVTDIDVVDGRARVRFTVREGVKLPTDSEAAVRWRNLLGQRYLYVYPGAASTVFESGDTVERTRSVIDLGELFNRLGPIVQSIEPDQVNAFLDTVVQAIDGNEPKLRQAIDDLAALAGALGERDDAIGRLVENVDRVAGAVVDREAQIRTVLDNLLALATTFNQNTDVLDTAITELGDVAEHTGILLEERRAEIDRIVTNLATLVDVIRQKLPQIDTTLTHLDEAAAKLFAASRLGEWLNQTIPCGRIGYPMSSSVTTECRPLPGGTAASVTPIEGRAAIDHILGMAVPVGRVR